MEGFGYVHTPVARGEGKEQTSAKPSDAQFAAGGVSRAIMEILYHNQGGLGRYNRSGRFIPPMNE